MLQLMSLALLVEVEEITTEALKGHRQRNNYL